MRRLFSRRLSAEQREEARRALHTLGVGLNAEQVRAFQRQRGITADGIVGKNTRRELRAALAERERSGMDPNLRVEGERRAPRLGEDPGAGPRAGELSRADEDRRLRGASGSPDGTQAQRFQYYANIVRANGGQVNPGGRPTVLGIRERNGVTRRFEDKIVVLTRDGRVEEFTGTTRPGNTTQRNGGVAQLRTGNYEVVPHRLHYGRPSYSVRTQSGSGDVPVARDLNGDGQYSPREMATPRTGDGILFHVPNPRYGDRIPTTIGCINIRNADWDRFVRAVGGPQGRFNFSLVDRAQVGAPRAEAPAVDTTGSRLASSWGTPSRVPAEAGAWASGFDRQAFERQLQLHLFSALLAELYQRQGRGRLHTSF